MYTQNSRILICMIFPNVTCLSIYTIESINNKSNQFINNQFIYTHNHNNQLLLLQNHNPQNHLYIHDNYIHDYTDYQKSLNDWNLNFKFLCGYFT